MATEPKAATEESKIDLFEDDDEFEEFEINEDNLAKRILEDHVVEGAKGNFVEVGKDSSGYHCYRMGKSDKGNSD
ncbi:hypothetical protein CsSME_00053329 [Camellia sinensis var. sinensis]